VVALYPDGQAQIRTPVGLETVDTSLIDDAHPGDLVLVHAGSVLSRVEEESL
jgi:hydrogenase maturation factor